MPPRKFKEKSETVVPVSAAVETPLAAASVSRRERRTTPVTFVLGVFSIIALGLAGYFYYQYSHTKEVMETKEIASLTERIGKAMELPANEVPTLATVTNKEKLDSQPFFKKAENGDKILIYVDAGRAVLYRPSTEKIIDVASGITITDGPAEGTPEEITPSPEPESAELAPMEPVAEPVAADPLTLPATVALYNGSKKVGVTNTLETELVGLFESISVSIKEKAVKNDYPENVIVDLSGQKTALVEALAEKIGGTIAVAVPVGETAPADADILIIIGNK